MTSFWDPRISSTLPFKCLCGKVIFAGDGTATTSLRDGDSADAGIGIATGS